MFLIGPTFQLLAFMKMTGNGETGLRSEMGESMLAMVQDRMKNRFVTMGGLLSWDANDSRTERAVCRHALSRKVEEQFPFRHLGTNYLTWDCHPALLNATGYLSTMTALPMYTRRNNRKNYLTR